MTSVFRMARAVARFMQEGFLLERPSSAEAIAYAATRPEFETKRRTVLGAVRNSIHRHWTGTALPIRLSGYDSDYFFAVVQSMCRSMVNQAYERMTGTARIRPRGVNRGIKTVNAQGETYFYRRTDPEIYRIMTRENNREESAYAGIVNRLNRFYRAPGTKRDVEPQAWVAKTGVLVRDSEGNIQPKTLVSEEVFKVESPSYPVLWISSRHPGSEGSINPTKTFIRAWASVSSLPRAFNSDTYEPRPPVLDPSSFYEGLMYGVETRTCASTGMRWVANNVYRGAYDYYAPHVYDIIRHGVDPGVDRERRRLEERRAAENPETGFIVVNLTGGRLLSYSANPIRSSFGDAWHGHGASPTRNPEFRKNPDGSVMQRKDGPIGIRYLGVELEVGYLMDKKAGRMKEGWNQPEAVKWAADKLSWVNPKTSKREAFCIMKSDGSITSVNGFEIVSRPAVLAKQVELWTPFLNEAYKKVSGYAHNVCGMHVHVSKNSLGKLQLGRMISFVNSDENRSFIEHVAGRGSVQYSRMCPKPVTCGLGYTDPGERRYDEERDRFIQVRPSRTRYDTRIAYGEDTEGRYSAINLETGKGTVEFRIFRSNVSKAGFLKNIEFVDALCVHALHASNKELGFKAFCTFAESRARSYPNLVAWLRRAGYLKDSTPKLAEFRKAKGIVLAKTFLDRAAA